MITDFFWPLGGSDLHIGIDLLSLYVELTNACVFTQQITLSFICHVSGYLENVSPLQLSYRSLNIPEGNILLFSCKLLTIVIGQSLTVSVCCLQLLSNSVLLVLRAFSLRRADCCGQTQHYRIVENEPKSESQTVKKNKLKLIISLCKTKLQVQVTNLCIR